MSYSPDAKQYMRIAEADETVSSSIVLQDDDELYLPYEQGILYEIEMLLNFTVDNASNGGVRINWTMDNAPVYAIGNEGFDAEDFVPQNQLNLFSFIGAADITNNAMSTGIIYSWYWRGIMLDATGPGNFQVQFAQENSNANGITRELGSWIKSKALRGASEVL